MNDILQNCNKQISQLHSCYVMISGGCEFLLVMILHYWWVLVIITDYLVIITGRW